MWSAIGRDGHAESRGIVLHIHRGAPEREPGVGSEKVRRVSCRDGKVRWIGCGRTLASSPTRGLLIVPFRPRMTDGFERSLSVDIMILEIGWDLVDVRSRDVVGEDEYLEQRQLIKGRDTGDVLS